MAGPSRFPFQQVTPPVRRPRQSPRPKLSIPSASPAAAKSSIPTHASKTVDEGASAGPVSACQMPLKLKNGAGLASLGSEAAGGSVGATETVVVAAMAAAAAVRNDRGADPPADTAGPGALPSDVNHQDGDSNTTPREITAAAAVAAATAGEGSGSRSSTSSEAPKDAPGQGTVPAGLLWSDFGGGREAGEDAEETASREFAEESFGMFHGVRLESDSVARSQVRSCRRGIFVLWRE